MSPSIPSNNATDLSDTEASDLEQQTSESSIEAISDQLSDGKEEDDIILPLRRSSTRNASSCPDLPANHQTFQARLCEIESVDDLKLLYPLSLWDKEASRIIDNEALFLSNVQKLGHSNLHDVADTTPYEGEFYEFELTEFAVYNSLTHKRYPGQYEHLHMVSSEADVRDYLLDGVVDHDGSKVSLRGAVISRVSIGGLDLSSNSCEDQIWVMTRKSAKTKYWYRLTLPNTRYQPFWHEFLWIANFAKYCIDYITLAEKNSRLVTLRDFQYDFKQTIIKHFGKTCQFRNWDAQSGGVTDLRRHVTKHVWFIYDQHWGVMGDVKQYQKHPVWGEAGYGLSETAIDPEDKTLVTRNAANTFLPSFPQWGASTYDLLRQEDCDQEVESHRQTRLRNLKLSDKFSLDQGNNFRFENHERWSKVEWTLHDAAQRDTSARCKPDQLQNKLVIVRQGSDNDRCFDFALVKDITPDKKHARIIWMTLPSNTICGTPQATETARQHENNHRTAYYPIGNELFISDDCNCRAIRISDIIGVYDIATSAEVAKKSGASFIATMQYCERDQCFIKPVESELKFTCPKPCVEKSSERHLTVHRRRNTRNCAHSKPPNRVPNEGTLRNISLFTGCGLFDRGLESSGIIKTTLSIDCNPFAISSAKANCSAPVDGEWLNQFVVASVNSELDDIMKGRKPYPNPGSLSAGCPCQGFSLANMYKDTKKSQRNCTLLVSTLSWIEVTLPAYVAIENVMNMDSASRSPSACSQAIAFLVALGYQVRKIRLNASDFGGSTSRKRLFIVAAAPSYQLPDAPLPTHGSTDGLHPSSTIGMTISDLTGIHNDTLVNTLQPYHVPLTRLVSYVTTTKVNFRDIVHRIPKTPVGQGVSQCRRFLNRFQKDWFDNLPERKSRPNSHMLQRVKKDGYFPTIVTGAYWRDANTGQILHYDQDRILSLEEVARAQGVPGDFVLVGSINQQLKQVGNAVPWCLREAIGREIAKAYSQSHPLGETDQTPEKSKATDQGSNSKGLSEVKRGSNLENTDVSEDSDEEVIWSTRSDFELAFAKRTSSTTSYNPSTNELKKTSHTKIELLPSTHGSTTHAKAIKQNSFEYTSMRRSPSGTTAVKTEARRSLRISKRSRSSTVVSEDEAVARKRAKQESMEAERRSLGASTGQSSESDSDEEVD